MAFKILLADDSVTAQNLAKKILTDVGYDVVAVSNGAAAMKKINAERPDMLILDVYMPGYSGLEVCEKIRAATETASLPVLLTVAPMEPYNPADGNRVRADGVILKPFEARDLVPAVEKLQEKTASLRPATVPAAVSGAAEKAAAEAQPTAVEYEFGSEEQVENTLPAPLPELPEEMAVAPAFDLGQFEDQFETLTEAYPSAPSSELVANTNEAPLPPAERAEDTLHSMDVIEAELVSQSLQEFDLLGEELQEESEAGSLTLASEATVAEEKFLQDSALADTVSGFQAELESDAANGSLGEMGFAAGLPAENEREPVGAVDLDFSPETFAAETPATDAKRTDDPMSGQDPELMVDRTQMIEFATRFGSEAAEDVPVGVTLGGGTFDAGPALLEPQEHKHEHDELQASADDEPAIAELMPQEQWQQQAQEEPEQEEPEQEEPEQGEPEQGQARAFEQDELQEAYELADAEANRVERVAMQADGAELSFAAPAELTPGEDTATAVSELHFGAATLQAEIAGAGAADNDQNASVEQNFFEEQGALTPEWDAPPSVAEQSAEENTTWASASSRGDSEPFEISASAEIDAEGTAATLDIDEQALEEAVSRVLDRLRPQILSELVRELAHHRG